MKIRKTKKDSRKQFFYKTCPNCGEKGPHYVPPSLGEPGFFICKKKAPEGEEK